jgi:hypothetical protein
LTKTDISKKIIDNTEVSFQEPVAGISLRDEERNEEVRYYTGKSNGISGHRTKL